MSPVKVANGDRDGLAAYLQQMVNKGTAGCRESSFLPKTQSQVSVLGVSSIRRFLGAFMVPDPHRQPGEMMVPLPESSSGT